MRIKKVLFYFLAFVFVMLLTMYVYRFVFLFDGKLVTKYVQEEADQYGKNSKIVKTILTNAVKNIKSNAKLVNSIKASAKAANIEKERVLVNIAIAECLNNKLLTA